MKKRILGMLLCLVMVVSLLPITAAAATDYKFNSASITSSGWRVGDLGLGYDVYQLNITDWKLFCGDTTIQKGAQFFDAFSLISYDKDSTIPLTSSPEAGVTYYVRVMISCVLVEDGNTYSVSDSNFGANLTITGVTGFNATFVSAKTLYNQFGDGIGIDMLFTMIKEDVHEHDWSYEVSKAGNSLKAICGNSGCDIGTVSVTLKAQSVTLPKGSPFNAQLEFEGDFKEVFNCSEVEYQYEDPDTGWKYVDPDTFTPQPGNYQAGVLISGLPGNGGVAEMSLDNEDGAGQGGATAYLYVKYTAVDPAVTAQTGDDRPIELMIVSVLVFSAIAVAAFALDRKRKYSR